MRALQGFFSGFWRKLGYIAAAALVALVVSFVGTGQAHAANPCNLAADCDKGEAYAAASAGAANANNDPNIGAASKPTYAKDNTVYYNPSTGEGGFGIRRAGDTGWIGGDSSRDYYSKYAYHACVAPKVWDETSKTCHNPDSCLAKNESLGNSVAVTDTDTNGCNEGCATSMGADYEVSTFTVGGNQRTFFTGKSRYTGAACAVTTKAPDSPEPECYEIDGTTSCKRADGKICGKSSGGKYHCWGTGETGTKTDGPNIQEVKPGPPPPTPPPPIVLPSGDTAEPSKPPVGVTNSGPGRPTTNTTINNYTTVNGTNAGPTGGGGQTGPTGDAPGDGEEGEGDEGSVTGGGTCDAAPTCSGGVIDCAILNQAWANRCEGNPEGIAALQAFDQALLDEALTEAVDNGAVLGVDGQGDMSQHQVVKLFGGDELDASGFLGSGGCPSFPTPSAKGIAIPIDFQKICDLLSTISNMVMALAYYLAFRIIAGGGSK